MLFRSLGRAVRADRTVTFTLPKTGQFVGEGALLSGKVTVHDIGIPAGLARQVPCPVQTVEAGFAAAALPPRKRDGHKGDFGKVLVAGGSVGYTGAPYLTASAAVRSGCGLVYLGGWQKNLIRSLPSVSFCFSRPRTAPTPSRESGRPIVADQIMEQRQLSGLRYRAHSVESG